MRRYELMFVVKPTLEEEATTTVLENIKTILKDQKARIVT